jgi:hypothetical protein
LSEENNMLSSKNIKTIQYLTDKVRGASILAEMSDTDWVEFIKTHTNVYFYPSMPTEIYQDCKAGIINQWRPGYEQLGFIRSLALDRFHETFVMPLFAVQKDNDIDNILLTCGNSRFIANLVNGIAAVDIPLILLSATPPKYQGWQEIQSTQQFIDLFKLKDIDHEITINMDNNVSVVTRSVIRHSIYDYANQNIQFAAADEPIKQFWEKFSQGRDKIDITIWCTEETKSLIQETQMFNITYMIQKPTEWEFSFGKIAGAYRPEPNRPSRPAELYLYLYDIVEPVNLHLLLVWPTTGAASFYSANKKSVLLDTSDKTSTVIIGNWVK